MIDHQTRYKDGTWGVSHNENGVLLKVCSFNGIDRVRLCAEEIDEVIAELEHHKVRGREATMAEPGSEMSTERGSNPRLSLDALDSLVGLNDCLREINQALNYWYPLDGCSEREQHARHVRLFEFRNRLAKQLQLEVNAAHDGRPGVTA